MTDTEDPALRRDPTPTAGGTASGVVRAGVSRLLSPDNPWRTIVTKAASVTAAMLGLAAIGLFAARAESRGGESEATLAAAQSFNASLGTSWLSPARELGKKAARQGPSSPPEITASAAVHEASGSPRADPAQAAPSATSAAPASGITSDGKVILNVATASELTRLPGIGAKRAEKIVALRTRLKRFRKASDLLRIRGIGLKSLRKMLPHLVLDPPPAEKPESPPAAEKPESDSKGPVKEE